MRLLEKTNNRVFFTGPRYVEEGDIALHIRDDVYVNLTRMFTFKFYMMDNNWREI